MRYKFVLKLRDVKKKKIAKQSHAFVFSRDQRHIKQYAKQTRHADLNHEVFNLIQVLVANLFHKLRSRK